MDRILCQSPLTQAASIPKVAITTERLAVITATAESQLLLSEHLGRFLRALDGSSLIARRLERQAPHRSERVILVTADILTVMGMG